MMFAFESSSADKVPYNRCWLCWVVIFFPPTSGARDGSNNSLEGVGLGAVFKLS